ncbi:efflux RND transporter periplasmic adaptor subunit [Clostridium aminobutyricum]|uniref:Efflux RND transporter periplasmic adaptor subunit n=1 Tax=Clostridium aminobutyricum TaxID=33953 RepID=A0A939IFS2_CLOAM|nr:efflux RND transporter periplasmic adaptor subunit [Clostridium aminobutyricum]MBN7771805.1 efflux RND transporter periplasmic adaptor subunit [Clostridium aminobutyricum]
MNKCRIYIVLMIVIVFLLSGCTLFRQEAKIVDDKSDTEKVTAQQGSIDEKDALSGRAEAGEAVSVVSKTAGKVAAVLADIGSEVKKGQVLLRLDARDLEASVESAKASLESANVAYKYALENQQRAVTLKAQGAMSLADYQNNYESVLEKAQSTVDLARANLDKAEIAYQDSIIVAPMDGTVTKSTVEVGELVNSQTPAFTIVNLDQVKIQILVNENKINSLRVGQTYQVKLSAIPEETFVGKITDISEAMDTDSKAYPVRITVENPQHLIKDGMFAKVYLSESSDSSTQNSGGQQ